MPTYRQLSAIPRWVKVTKTHQDFSTGGLTNNITIYSLPANAYVHDVKIVPTTNFSGGAIASYTLSVGITGSLAKYAVAADVFTGNTTTDLVHTSIAGLESRLVATDLKASATSTVGNLNASTAGAVTFYLLLSALP